MARRGRSDARIVCTGAADSTYKYGNHLATGIAEISAFGSDLHLPSGNFLPLWGVHIRSTRALLPGHHARTSLRRDAGRHGRPAACADAILTAQTESVILQSCPADSNGRRRTG